MSIGAKQLSELAEGDYKMCLLAEKDFPDEYAVRGAVYHLQQAIEKVMKAAVLLNGETPPFTHNIGTLAARCKKLGVSFSEEYEAVYDAVSFWESSSRYDPYFTFTEKAYQQAKGLYMEAAEKIKTILEGILNLNKSEENPQNGKNSQ